jgi:vacuolar-type H+-ATPase subunit I/STV1
VTKNSKEALREQAVAMLMLDLKRAEERADAEGWIDADDLERELGVID